MTDPTAADLYDRQLATLLASWEANARGSDGAAVLRLSGVTDAIFPAEPERGIYNNAVLARGLKKSEHAAAVTAMEAAYADAGVESFAAWVHESDEDTGSELSERDYEIVEQTPTASSPPTSTARPSPPGSPSTTTRTAASSTSRLSSPCAGGIGAALTGRLLEAARSRGCTTASLRSTAAAERVYAALGFRDLGRFIEYAKSPGDRR